jgi:hypothetical protein
MKSEIIFLVKVKYINCLNTVQCSAQPISWKNWAKSWMIYGNYSLDGGLSMWAVFASYNLTLGEDRGRLFLLKRCCFVAGF